MQDTMQLTVSAEYAPRAALGAPDFLQSVGAITFVDQKPALHFFTGQGDKALVTIRPDGEVEIAEGVSLSEASRAFWNGIKRMAPSMFGANEQPAAVVRHVSTQGGEKQAAAFLLTQDLPDGTHLYASAARAVSRGAAFGDHHHTGRATFGEREPKAALPPKSNAEILAVYHGMKSVDILRGVEEGSHGDAILIAFARALGVPA